MSKIKKRYFFPLIAFIIFGFGCANIAKNFGEGLGQGFKEANILYFALIWYHKVHNAWPSSPDQLSLFINEHSAPIDISKYDKISFSEDESGNLKCYFRMKTGAISSKRVQIFARKSAAQEVSFPIWPFSDDTIELKQDNNSDS